MEKTIKIIEGKVEFNRYGNWDDVDKGWFLDGRLLNSIFREYGDRKIRVTIEEIDEEIDDGE